MTESTLDALKTINDRSDIARHAKPARMHPKEHGAYAILGVPLVTSLLLAGLTPATVLVATAAVFAFLAHEPLMIVTGRRGATLRNATPRALQVLWARLAVAVLSGVVAFSLTNWSVRLGMIACLLLASSAYASSAKGLSRTLAAQLLGIGCLTLPGTIVLASVGTDLTRVASFWLVWVVGRVATTVGVRASVVHNKETPVVANLRAYDLLLATTLLVAGYGVTMGNPIWISAGPLLAAAMVLRMLTPSPKHLKSIGWSLLAVNIVAAILQVYLWHQTR
jgi:hypothetical protein